MPNNIDSGEFYVTDLFDGKWYCVPSYQRPYVWEDEQVSELLDDILQALTSSPKSDYFLGSMVFQRRPNEEDSVRFEDYDLLDGQQRVTTLFLMLAVLRDLNIDKDSLISETCASAIIQEKNPIKRIPERIRVKFQVRNEVRVFIDKYVKTLMGTQNEDIARLAEKEKDINIKNMSKAILNIKEFFEGIENHGAYVDFLFNNVLLIYVASDKLEDAFRLFTVMNNRGMKLRNSDILKAENLKEVPEERQDEYAKKWEELEEYHGDKFDNFLSHVRTILVKQKAGYNLYKEYEDNIYNPKEFNKETKKSNPVPPLMKKGTDTFDNLMSFHSCYREIFDEDHFSDFNSYEYHNLVQLMQTGFEADFWVTPLLRYFQKFNTTRLLDFVKLLDKKYSADWIIGITPTIRMQNMISIIKKIDTADHADDVLYPDLFNVNKTELLRVLSGDVYRKKFDRYILLKIDMDKVQSGVAAKIPKTISIEHILPQKPDPNSSWISDFTDTQRVEWTNKLGNLILLSRAKNTSQGNKDYTDKKTGYYLKSIESFSITAYVMNKYNSWTLSDLMSNHKEMLKQVMNLYGFTITDDEISEMIVYV
ncbi:MAG: DUF262 domain-containing HNH endonuclease family protein [Candidatus Cloacimonetes bacterium]|nr:DUF262 domain-containing HNH endonuclease family protein [Candidatus Cloacimonadota bacterium]